MLLSYLLSAVPSYCIAFNLSSDIHADSERNQIWVREHCLRRPEDTESDTFTVMIIPGDVGSDLDRITLVFSHLVTQYDLVCFVPGNHELWRRGTALSPNLSDLSHDATAESSAKSSGGSNRMAPNSIAKMQEILLCAETQGVRIGPVKVNFAEKRNLLLQPLHAWYHSSWDTEPDLTHPDFLAVEEVIPFHRKWGDYSLCSWPPEIIDQRTFVANPTNNTVLAEAFAQLNEEHLHPVPSSSSVSTLRKAAAAVNLSTIFGSPHADPTTTIISFSHYLPRQELCPEKRLLLEPLLSRVVGSDVLEAQIRRLQPHLHLFGHTHVPIDLTLENIVYLQWPLGYHRESTQQCAPIHRHGPLLCFDSLLGDGVDSLPNDRLSLNSGWSKHYRQPGARRPEITDELAPWVQKRLQSFSGLVYSHKERLLRSLEQEKQESDGTNEDRNDQ